MAYLFAKHLHISCVILSVVLFASRGLMQLAGYPWRRWHWLRWVPHVVDTVLLGSALYMATQISQYPFTAAWLTAKFLALVAYVLLGKRALSVRTPPAQARLAFVLALLCVAYIVAVAITHSPSLGWLG